MFCCSHLGITSAVCVVHKCVVHECVWCTSVCGAQVCVVQGQMDGVESVLGGGHMGAALVGPDRHNHMIRHAEFSDVHLWPIDHTWRDNIQIYELFGMSKSRLQ